MGYKLNIPLIVMLTCCLFVSCLKKADLTGFFYSSDNPDQRFTESESWNKAYGQKRLHIDKTSYVLFIAGDTHFGEFKNFRKFLNAAKDSCDFYCLAGDVTSGRKEDYDRLDTFLIFNDVAIHYFIPGNHDLYFNGWQYYFRLFGSSVYTLKVNTKDTDDLFIFLDSGNGTLGKKQLSWLETILHSERNKHRYCFILTHVNFFREHQTTSTNPLPDELHHLMDLFAKNNVTVVFMGHDHKRSVEHFGKTTYITLDALHDGTQNASYLSLKINPNNFEFTFIPIN